MPTDEPPHPAVSHILAMVAERTGYDFSDYQEAFVLRRIRRVAEAHDMSGPVELAATIGSDPTVVDEVINSLCLTVTDVFRDPPFWRSLREEVIPDLSSETLIRAWVAGCATGEEAFSLAILLNESGLCGRYRIYATDLSSRALGQARKGLSAATLTEADERHRESGGTGDLGEQWDFSTRRPAGCSDAVPDSIVFARHNLAVDESFNSFHLILCRNVMIYFNEALHRRAHRVIFDSLLPGGVLGLGTRESIRPAPDAHRYQQIGTQRLFRRRP